MKKVKLKLLDLKYLILDLFNPKLSQIVKRKLKKEDFNCYKGLKIKDSLRVPSKRTFFLVIVIYILLLFISNAHNLHFIVAYAKRIFRPNESFILFVKKYLLITDKQLLITICTGIGAVLIGLAFFVAQSFYDKEEPNKARVLLYTSNFYWLLTLEIVTLLTLLFGNPNVFITVPLLFLGLAAIWSLGNTIRVLQLPKAMEDKKWSMIQNIFKNHIKFEILNRICNRELFNLSEELTKEYNSIFKFNPYYTSSGNHLMILAGKEIIIRDIKIRRLNKLILKINKNTLKSKGEIRKEPLLILKAYLSKMGENQILFEVHSELIDKAFNEKKINKIIKSIFISSKKDYENEAEIERSRIKLRCNNMIEKPSADELIKSLEAYRKIIETEYEVFEKCGGLFSMEGAERERTAMFGQQFRFHEWISRDVREIYDKALETKNYYIIRNVLYFPISLCTLSIKHSDNLIFQTFISYPVIMYSEARRINDDDRLKNYIIDRSWRYLVEMTNFTLTYQYDRKNILQTQLKDYSYYIFKTFQNLLKQSYDYKDIKSFELYLEKMMKIYEHLDYSKDGVDVHSEIENLRNQVLFGIGSWLQSKLEIDETTEISFYNHILKYIQLNIIKITELFIDVYDKDMGFNRDWDDWELEEKEEGEAHWIGTSERLKTFYVILCLDKVRKHPSPDNISLPYTNQFALIIPDLIKKIEDIEDNKDKWGKIVSANALLKTEALKELFNKTKEKQEEEEKSIIRNTRISNEKVALFKQHVIESIQETNGIRTILNTYKRIKFKTYEEAKALFGINQYFDKSAFLADDVQPHVIWGQDFGTEYGRSIISGEDSAIINSLTSKLDTISQDKITSFLEKEKDNSELVVIAINKMGAEEIQDEEVTYIPSWYADFNEEWYDRFSNGIEGVIKYKNKVIPVIEIFGHDLIDEIQVLDTSKFELIQYMNKDAEVDDDLDNCFNIEVTEIIEGSSIEKEILNKAPDWLKKYGNRQAQALHIREKVIVKILERFELRFLDDIVGVRITE